MSTRSPAAVNRPPATVRCPNCAASVEWTPEQLWRPFCSERCRLVDLGDWLDERNRIPDQPDVTDPYPESG